MHTIYAAKATGQDNYHRQRDWFGWGAGLSAYAASKSALTGFVKSVAREVADKNITVNNIAAGYMEGGMAFEIPVAIREKITQEIPMKKFGLLHEICPLIEYMISEHASYLTGQTIGLNGGLD